MISIRLGQPKSIKKHFPGQYIQSWKKFKDLHRNLKTFQGLPLKFKGLFKTVRALGLSSWPVSFIMQGEIRLYLCNNTFHLSIVSWASWWDMAAYSWRSAYKRNWMSLLTVSEELACQYSHLSSLHATGQKRSLFRAEGRLIETFCETSLAARSEE